ncbi:ABC transporter permease [Chloroflexi bacterium TSY]|nr:ABC transporter permease [Chloroflexi bacterium TSY]
MTEPSDFPTTAPEQILLAKEPLSQRAIVWRSLKRNKLSIIGMTIIILLFVTTFGAPLFTSYDPIEMSPRERLQSPSLQHWLGTDSFGRDMFARILYGGRVSLSVGVAAVTLLMAIGIVLGSIAGYYGGWADSVIMRFVDVMLSIPNFFLLLTIVALFGPSLRNTMIIIGLTSWMATARIVRGQFLAERQKDYVTSARSIGASHARIIWHHLLPNTVAVIIVYATLWFAFSVILEASLSYLGLGAQPPTPSWGNMLREGRRYMRDAWWVTTFPGLFIFLTAICFNLLGDGLRDALDPRLNKR